MKHSDANVMGRHDEVVAADEGSAALDQTNGVTPPDVVPNRIIRFIVLSRVWF